jgi:hypothetical protein
VWNLGNSNTYAVQLYQRPANVVKAHTYAHYTQTTG